MNVDTIFETAARKKLRFNSIRGEITAEDLWDLPLTSKNGFNLDSVARGISGNLKSMAEESFVEASVSPAKAIEETKLEIVKRVIAVRKTEAEEARTASARREEREKLLTILQQKKDDQLSNLSVDELQARLAELGAG